MTTYQVLARKYRSQSFNDLIGQDVLVKTLTTAIETNRVSHAYIFTGVRGVGKTSTARILAKALNCLGPDGNATGPTAHPCNVCDNCRAITAGAHIDVMEIDAASHTGVDNIRDILDASNYRPTNGRYKIYIIDEVHMLTKNAFNALLKTLEEPPSHIIFILATTEIRKVPITILSRCQRFDLVRIDLETLKKHFMNIAKSENVNLTDSACDLIARAADGSVRDGLSLLDQAIAATSGNIDETAVLSMLKRADRHAIVPLMETMLSGDIDATLDSINSMYIGGSDLNLLLGDMMELTYWLTRIYIAPASITNAPYTSDNRDQMKRILEKTTLNTLSRIWQMMVSGVSELQTSTNVKQSFDMLIIRMMHLSDVPPIATLLENNKLSTPTQPVTTKIVSGQKTVAAIIKKPTISNIQQLLTELQNAREQLLAATVKTDIEIIHFESGKISYFARRHDATFANKLKQFLDDKTDVKWTLDEQLTSSETHTLDENERAAAADDPMVSNALDMFAGAEISTITKN